MAGRKPDFNFRFYNKQTKVSAECGAAWLSDYNSGISVRPQLETVDGKYPKMSMVRALELVAKGDGTITMWPSFSEVGPRKVVLVAEGQEESEEEVEF